MSNLNPWLILILGILIGWVFQWLLELWTFRRELTTSLADAQQRLAAAQKRIDALEVELRRERDRANALHEALAAYQTAAPTAATPAADAPATTLDPFTL
jgi:type VI protein secretion system component VasK